MTEMTKEAARAPHEIYLMLCRLERVGDTGTDEYKALTREYYAAIDREIKAGRGV
jgi:hypothetical protein